jgi:hypothetical protein
MYRDVLQSIAGIEIYPIIALILFLAAGVFIGIRVWRMDKHEIEHLSRLPLRDDRPRGGGPAMTGRD